MVNSTGSLDRKEREEVARKSSDLRRFFTSKRVNLELLDALPLLIPEFPTGWSSPWELTLLYNFAKYGKGSILEIGPWIGRSTMALALGIRDGSSNSYFDIVDFGITSGDEWQELLQIPFKDFCDTDQIARAIHTQGGSMALLIDNLRKHDLLRYTTTIMRGNALRVPLRNCYEFIFCDTLHDEREIHAYGSLLNKKLAPGGIIICDDVIDDRLGKILRTYVEFEHFVYLNPQDSPSNFAIGCKVE